MRYSAVEDRTARALRHRLLTEFMTSGEEPHKLCSAKQPCQKCRGSLLLSTAWRRVVSLPLAHRQMSASELCNVVLIERLQRNGAMIGVEKRQELYAARVHNRRVNLVYLGQATRRNDRLPTRLTAAAAADGKRTCHVWVPAFLVVAR
jgi:hypothetical protein